MPTKEEREERNAYERERYAALPEEEKKKILDSHAEWVEKRKEVAPEAHAAAQREKIKRQQERYKSDPEYRERIKAYQRDAARKRREKKRAEKAAAKAANK
jgi:hypothetical protein